MQCSAVLFPTLKDSWSIYICYLEIFFLFIAFSVFISKVSVITCVYISWSQVQILVQEVADLQ